MRCALKKVLPPWAWVRDVSRRLPDVVWPPDSVSTPGVLLVFQVDRDDTEGGSPKVI